MPLSSKTIKLSLIGVLVGSTVGAGAGYLMQEPEQEVVEDPNNPQNHAGTVRGGHGGVFIAPRLGGFGGGIGGGVGAAPSARGGFGSSGLGGSGSSAS